MKVLFVCSGNICRSPMAEACLRARARRAGVPGLEVASAGTLGIEDARASDEAIAVLREIGLDLSGHRSRGVTRTLVEDADLVLAMEREHLHALDRAFPGGDGRRFLMRAFERGPEPDPDAADLPDPMGRPIGAYRAVLAILDPAVGHLLEFLRQRDRASAPGVP